MVYGESMKRNPEERYEEEDKRKKILNYKNRALEEITTDRTDDRLIAIEERKKTRKKEIHKTDYHILHTGRWIDR